MAVSASVKSQIAAQTASSHQSSQTHTAQAITGTNWLTAKTKMAALGTKIKGDIKMKTIASILTKEQKEAICLAIDALTWSPSSKERAIAALKIVMEQDRHCIDIAFKEIK